MDLWFTEQHTSNVRFSIKIDRQIFSEQSDFQRIDVFQSPEFGRVLTLDGYVMLTEKDEFIYHEMITHVPMAVHPNVKKVLIIGGGDGGVAKELINYPSIEHIDVVETDKMFVDVCRKFFPEVASGLDDPRITMYYDDGLRFLRGKSDEYDLIINDSTDPLGHTEGLFTKEFYGSCYKALKEDGIMVYQHGSPFYDEDEIECRKMHRKVYKSFKNGVKNKNIDSDGWYKVKPENSCAFNLHYLQSKNLPLYTSLLSDMARVKNVKDLDDLTNQINEIKSTTPKFLLVSGEAGSDKSVLCKKILENKKMFYVQELRK